MPACDRGLRKALGWRWKPSFGCCWLLLTVLLAGGGPAHAQTANPFTHYVSVVLTHRNGLPQDSVSAIAQTADGFLWFGTQEGLARFDGVNTTVFDTSTQPGLIDNYILTLLTGGDRKTLWIGTRSGVSCFAGGSFHRVFSPGRPIKSLFQSSDGVLWVATEGMLYTVSAAQGSGGYAIREELPNASIGPMLETPDGAVWLASEIGLLRYKNHQFTPVQVPGVQARSAILGMVLENRGTSLWLATDFGLTHAWLAPAGSQQVFTRAEQHTLPAGLTVRTMVEDRAGRLWLGFDHAGVGRMDGETLSRYTVKDGLISDSVSSLFESGRGQLWVGTDSAGAVQLREGLFDSFGRQEGLGDNTIWTVLEAHDGTLWVGTDSKGLDHILKDGTVQSYGHREGMPDDSTAAVHQTPDGAIWVAGAHRELTEIKGGKLTRYRLDGADARIDAILDGPGGSLWLLLHRKHPGLVHFHNGSTESFEVPGLPNTADLAPDGSLWIGSDHAGVTHWRNGAVVETYGTKQGLLSDFAQAVYVDSDGVVWAGTSPGGLNRIKNGRITTYSLAQGMYDLTVGAIVEDNYGNLWMTSNHGIFRASKAELDAYAEGRVSLVHVIAYSAADGMREEECNFGNSPSVWRRHDGRLLFATTAGVASIDPRHMQAHVPAPSIVFEPVHSRGVTVDERQRVTVQPGDNNLEVPFEAPDFISPLKLRFRYRLWGLETNWTEAGRRRAAFYTHLPPGRYSLQVQAARDGADWDGAVGVLSITVLPHLWQSWWFKLLASGCTVMLVVGFLRLRTRALVRQNLLLETKVNHRTRELEAAVHLAEAAQAAMVEHATKDSLTKLWNRRSIYEIIEREMARSLREQQSFCLLLADLDHFKSFNDLYGHLAGDRVIQAMAECIHGMLRPYDAAGRFGGEEFLIVLPNCTLQAGLHRAEELRAAVEKQLLPIGEHTLRVTCSIGLSAYAGGDLEELIAEADEALYRAKHQGRNRVCVHGAVQPHKQAETEGPEESLALELLGAPFPESSAAG